MKFEHLLLVLCFPMIFCCGEEIPKVLLISIDGFGHKYIETLPDSLIGNLKYLIQNGVKAKWLENVFPTMTYPNHYTMLTGLYPESHGLVHNTFYDRPLNDYFTIDNVKDNFDPKWYTAETIYYTNHKAGSGRFSGSVAFPTGVTPSRGIQLDHVVPDLFWKNLTDAKRSHEEVDTVVNWFLDKDKPINLGLLYFAEPDEVAHKYGPDANETHAIIGKINEAIGYLKCKLEAVGLLDDINIIIVADHGQVNHKGYVNLDECVDRALYTRIHNGGIIEFVTPNQGYNDRVYAALQNCSNHLHVYKKGGPELTALHFSNNPRIAPLVLEPDIGYAIVNNDYKIPKNLNVTPGHHGYDPRKDSDLYPLFIASGPAFKKGYNSGPVRIVDIYSLMCALLGLEPAPNNGSLIRVQHLLVHQPGNGCGRIAINVLMLLLAVTSFALKRIMNWI